MLRVPDAKIVIAGMMMPPNLGEDYIRAFSAMYPAIAEKNHLTLVPFLLKGVGGVASLNQPDAIHPTAEGHAIVAEIDPYVREDSSKKSREVFAKDFKGARSGKARVRRQKGRLIKSSALTRHGLQSRARPWRRSNPFS